MTDSSKEILVSNSEFAKTRECYSEIMQILVTNNVAEGNLPTYEEWCDMVDNEQLHPEPTLGFTPGIGKSGMAAMGFAAKIGQKAFSQAGFSNLDADGILNEVRTKAEAGLRQRARQTASKVFTSMKDEGDGGTSKPNFTGGSRFNPTGLSQNLKPIDTSFNTDVKFIGQTRYWQDGAENTGPLLIKQGTPGLTSTASGENRDDFIWNQISGPITTVWNAEIAKRVTWTGRVVTLLTPTAITDYINTCLQVCAIYYFWMSIIAFTDDPRNRNGAMDTLRENLLPDDYNRLNNLRRSLMQTAIPPFVHKYMFYLMGTYRQNHLPNSPLMKIMPFGFESTTLKYFSGAIATYNGKSPVEEAENLLIGLREFNNILARAVGDWGGIEPYYYTSSPRCDMDYTTFWTNGSYLSNYSPGGTLTEVIFPRIATEESEVVYNSHTDAPDGWVSAHVSPICINNSYSGTGLFHVWKLNAAGSTVEYGGSVYSTNLRSSCMVWSADSTVGFHPIEVDQSYQSISGNTYAAASMSNVYRAFQRFGTERIILTPINALRQAHMQFIDLLFTEDISSIGSGKMLKSKDNKMSGAYKGRRRSKKSEDDMED